jgi:CubicO group peptidase (beta-lactamase class C family)
LKGAGLALAFVFAAATAISAQDRPPASATPPVLTGAGAATFFDEIVPKQLQSADVAGAVVAIVKDGQVLFARGYGYADVAAKRLVSADATLFRIGSISKLFTWTAVMQLVEQGKLDLDRDVNQYLDVRIPATFAEPITLRHLMTHTAGLEAAFPDHSNWPGTRAWPLRDYLAEFMPPRIYPPGTTPAYSNTGAAIAGYIVARVSGQPFEEYVAEHILAPLGMTRSTFAQPLPAALAPMMSQGYWLSSEPSGPFFLVPESPSGSMSTTAADMGRFAIAQLQDGRLDNERILQPETAQLMHRRQFGLHPSMNAMAFGFSESNYNGYRVIGHGGGIRSFTSQLHLVPSLNLGFFFAQNSVGRGGQLSGPVWRAFADRYFPGPTSQAVASFHPASDARALSGLYRNSLRYEHSPMKLVTLRTLRRVTGNADGTVTVDGREMREVEPLVYRAIDGQARVAFLKRPNGTIEFIDDYPYRVFQRVPWYENDTLNVYVIRGAAAVFAATLLLGPFMRRRIALLVYVTCALDVIFLWAGYDTYLKLPNPGVTNLAHVLQAVGIIGASGTVVVFYEAVRCWSARDRGWFIKIHAAVLSLACLGFVGFALFWRLFDFSVG